MSASVASTDAAVHRRLDALLHLGDLRQRDDPQQSMSSPALAHGRRISASGTVGRLARQVHLLVAAERDQFRAPPSASYTEAIASGGSPAA